MIQKQYKQKVLNRIFYKLNQSQMINFTSLFSQVRSQQSNNTNMGNLLTQPNISIARLLNEESFLTQYKSNNSKVISFINYARVEELVEFVTIVGPPEDKKRSYKYPIVACDLLATDNSIIIQYFFPKNPLTVDQKIIEQEEVEVEIEDKQSPQVPKQKCIETVQPIIKDELKPAKIQLQSTELLRIESNQTKGASPKKSANKLIKKQMRKVEKVVKKPVKPLIDKLMSYFAGEINYTLAGYVCKILTIFFGKKQSQFMPYFLQQSFMDKVLNHAQSRSVGDLIVKVLTSENTICLSQRCMFFKSLLKRLSVSSEIYIISNLSACFCEIIEKIAANLKGGNKITEFNQLFFSLDVITQVIQNVISEEENVSVYNAPILFTYLTNVPFLLPQDQTIVDQFKQLLQQFIDKSLVKLQLSNRLNLGIGRIKILQILRFILKENILGAKSIIARKDSFLPTLLNLVKRYDMNNFLHNQVIKILQIELTEQENSPLNNALLKDQILLNFIVEQSTFDIQIKTDSSIYQYRKGYIAHIINFCLRIKEVSQKNTNIKKMVQSEQFNKIYHDFVEKEAFNCKKALAGFSTKKDIKHQIMFQKNKIIAAYATFLKKCPSPIFESKQNQVNIEHPDLVEELQKQIEANLALKQVEAKKDEDSIPRCETVAEETISPLNIFSIHLEYNLDDLMIDL